MEIIKALALHHGSVRVDGLDLYPTVSLHDFRTDNGQSFGVQVARGATVTFEADAFTSYYDGNPNPVVKRAVVLTLKGEIRAIEKALVAFLGTKVMDELLNL